MRNLFLLCFFICTATIASAQATFPFKDKTVIMRMVHSGKYVAGNAPANQGSRAYQLYKLANFYSEQWELQFVEGNIEGISFSRYMIYHVASQRYITFVGANQSVQLLEKFTNIRQMVAMQTFDFVKQTEAGRYKIHSFFHDDLTGLDYVLQVNNFSGDDGADITTALNVTIGNSQNQKFDLADLNPSPNPGSAIPSLEDKFEGRTIGIVSKQNNRQLKGDGATSLINSSADFAGFDRQFKIVYTNETGWYKILHKPSGKYVTVVWPVDGGDVQLKPDKGNDDHQKFKFIVQSANTYQIHSKYSYGPGALSVALVLEMVQGDDAAPMQLGKNLTVGNPWQQFVLTKYEPEAASFSSGTETNSSQKILGKQYYISNFESLALLEPYIDHGDTLVRVQPHPVYGEQSEWTIDDGTTHDGTHFYRFRYGKTGQYLFMPVANENTEPTANLKLKLKSDQSTDGDRRFEFSVGAQGTAQHTFNLYSGVGFYQNTDNKFILINDDGYLATEDANHRSTFRKNSSFIMNLSLPLDATKTYSIAVKTKGHFLSDSGIVGNNVPVVHAQYNDYSCNWHFILVGPNQYNIRNNLTGQYLAATDDNYASPVVTVKNANGDYAKWIVFTQGNYYRIQNVHSKRYLALMNHPNTGKPVFQGNSTDAGSLWLITRSDYFPDVSADPLRSQGLLYDYRPRQQNPYNNSQICSDMMKSIGLPFEPSAMPSSLKPLLIQEGFDFTHPPSFYPVLKSALKYQFHFTDEQFDQAMQNYKLDSAGHRVQLAYALKNYILEKLAKEDRSTWTYNESELVKWIERRINSIKKDYGDRMEQSWADFKASTLSGGDLPFDILLGPDLDYSKWNVPDYYPTTDDERQSLLEYAGICKQRNFTNPSDLASLSIPPISISGTSILISEVLKASWAPELLTRYNAIQTIVEELTKELRVGEVISEVDWYLKSANAARFTSAITNVSSASFITSVVVIGSEVLIMKAIDGEKFDDFESQLYAKINALKNASVSVNEIMKSSNLLNKFYLAQDFDYILATGQRFTPDDVALPVTITSIKAYQENSGVSVRWNVADEQNIDRYEIEKSTDGTHFKVAGEISASNSSEYTWVDDNPANGSNYYRIRVVENSTGSYYTNIVVVNNEGNASAMRVYPNPAKESMIGLQWNKQPEGVYTIQLCNSGGKKLLSKTITHAGGSSFESIYLPKSINKGVYYLVIMGNNKKEVLLVIVQ